MRKPGACPSPGPHACAPASGRPGDRRPRRRGRARVPGWSRTAGGRRSRCAAATGRSSPPAGATSSSSATSTRALVRPALALALARRQSSSNCATASTTSTSSAASSSSPPLAIAAARGTTPRRARRPARDRRGSPRRPPALRDQPERDRERPLRRHPDRLRVGMVLAGVHQLQQSGVAGREAHVRPRDRRQPLPAEPASNPRYPTPALWHLLGGPSMCSTCLRRILRGAACDRSHASTCQELRRAATRLGEHNRISRATLV